MNAKWIIRDTLGALILLSAIVTLLWLFQIICRPGKCLFNPVLLNKAWIFHEAPQKPIEPCEAVSAHSSS